jgi:hypothetical protein
MASLYQSTSRWKPTSYRLLLFRSLLLMGKRYQVWDVHAVKVCRSRGRIVQLDHLVLSTTHSPGHDLVQQVRSGSHQSAPISSDRRFFPKHLKFRRFTFLSLFILVATIRFSTTTCLKAEMRILQSVYHVRYLISRHRALSPCSERVPTDNRPRLRPFRTRL